MALALCCTAGLGAAAPQVKPSAGQLWQEALLHESGTGDLQRAVATYKRLVAEYGDDEGYAARALLRLGRCYQKLGCNTDARRAFQKLLAAYPEQVRADERLRLACLTALASDKTQPSLPTVVKLKKGGEIRGTIESQDKRTITMRTFGGPLTVRREEVASITHGRGQGIELAHDDGASDGALSTAGSGHAVLFDRPPGHWALTGVRVFGTRYGYPQPPDEPVLIYVCDDKMGQLAEARVPYATFEKGDPRWYLLRIPPVSVPRRFYICLSFRPHQYKGVYVHYDTNIDESHSRRALPGRHDKPTEKKLDWMIRAVLVQTEESR